MASTWSNVLLVHQKIVENGGMCFYYFSTHFVLILIAVGEVSPVVLSVPSQSLLYSLPHDSPLTLIILSHYWHICCKTGIVRSRDPFTWR